MENFEEEEEEDLVEEEVRLPVIIVDIRDIMLDIYRNLQRHVHIA